MVCCLVLVICRLLLLKCATFNCMGVVGDVDGQDGYEWVNASSGTGSSHVVPNNGPYTVVGVWVCVVI